MSSAAPLHVGKLAGDLAAGVALRDVSAAVVGLLAAG
jgi:hypothetical protein